MPTNEKRDRAYEALLPLAESNPKEFLRSVNAWMGADGFVGFCENYHGIDLDEDEETDDPDTNEDDTDTTSDEE